MSDVAEQAAKPDFSALKTRMQAAWGSGDYAVMGTTLQIVGELLCEAVDLRGGERVLDVAAGNGNATLAAARRYAEVTSTDFVGDLLERGRARADADRLPVTFQVADAEALPFIDGEFDVVLSTFGVMFAPDQEKAAAEMARVCRAGGRIGMANWTPASFVGQMFKIIGSHLPPPAGAKPPPRWGTEEGLRALFPGVRAIEARERVFNFRYRSVEHLLDVLRNYYGPIHKAFGALDVEKQRQLEADLTAAMSTRHTGGPGLVVPSEYLEVVIRR